MKFLKRFLPDPWNIPQYGWENINMHYANDWRPGGMQFWDASWRGESPQWWRKAYRKYCIINFFLTVKTRILRKLYKSYLGKIFI